LGNETKEKHWHGVGM